MTGKLTSQWKEIKKIKVILGTKQFNLKVYAILI